MALSQEMNSQAAGAGLVSFSPHRAGVYQHLVATHCLIHDKQFLFGERVSDVPI